MILDTFAQFDLSLLLALNGSDSLYLDGVMWAITRTSTWLLFFCALFYLIVKNNDFRQTLLIVLLVVLVVVVADQVASGLCKPYFQRYRPSRDPEISHLIDVVNGYRGGKYGFFSSHASNTFAVATFFALLFRRFGVTVCLYVWAILCSYSRLYLGVHYPSDVFTGLCFGVFTGIVFHGIYKYISKRYFSSPSHFSSKYTASGYLVQDFYVLLSAFSITCLYISLRALWYAVSF